MTLTEDAADFTDANLAQYEAVVWLSTTGNVLDETQQGAFERYIQAGGGYAGIHAASDTEYDWAWYGGLVGAYFNGHPAQQTATIKVAGRRNPSTEHLPNRWTRFDEWYNFRNYTDGSVRVLARLDESTYDAGAPRWATTTRSPGATPTTAGEPGTPDWATPTRRTASPPSCSTSWAGSSR